MIIAVSSILPSMAVIAFALRLLARKIKNLPLKADDYTILAALVKMCHQSIIG